MNDQQLSQEIESTKTKIDQISDELRLLHLKEGVLRSRLNESVEKQYKLNNESLRRRASRKKGEHYVSVDPLQSIITTAVIVDEQESNITNQVDNDTQEPLKYFDRDGTHIEIGDEIIFLTTGRNTSNTGVVDKISSTFVYCTDQDNIKTKRSSKNLRITSKYHEC